MDKYNKGDVKNCEFIGESSVLCCAIRGETPQNSPTRDVSDRKFTQYYQIAYMYHPYNKSYTAEPGLQIFNHETLNISWSMSFTLRLGQISHYEQLSWLNIAPSSFKEWHKTYLITLPPSLIAQENDK